MTFDDTSRNPGLVLPSKLRSYLVRRFGGLPSNWWELLTPKGVKYCKQNAVPAEITEQSAQQSIKRMCMTGRGKELGTVPKCRRAVHGLHKYCDRCAEQRKRGQQERSKRQISKDSPIGAEALTKPEMRGGNNDPITTKTASNFPTQKEAA